MESKERTRSGRSLFEMAEIRDGWAAPRRNGPVENLDPRLKTLSLSDRQLTLAIGALEHALEELNSLPATDQARKEVESCLFVMRQAQPALPPPKTP